MGTGKREKDGVVVEHCYRLKIEQNILLNHGATFSD